MLHRSLFSQHIYRGYIARSYKIEISNLCCANKLFIIQKMIINDLAY
jgi:hypothetical protein